MSIVHARLVKASLVDRLVVAGGVTIPLLGCLAAVLLMAWLGWMGWAYLGLLVGGWLISGLGVTIGFHRLLAHRAFETYRWLRACWAVLGAFSAQGPPLRWCAVHRKHHELSDQPGDPHSPHQHGEGWWNSIRGLVHSHVGWIFDQYSSSRKLIKHYVPDLSKDPLLVGIERTYLLWFLMGLAIPALIGFLVTGGWMGLLLGFLWGGLVRIFLVHHITWSINSICHTFGRREFESPDLSRNNLLCGLLGHGEGWHNNHHAFPTSARHGLRWWQFDLSWLIIRTMQSCGLAWQVRTPAKAALQAKRLNGGPSSPF